MSNVPTEDPTVPVEPTITKEVAYQEMYSEMRRVRDYEFSSAFWFIAIQASLVAGVASMRYGDSDAPVDRLLKESCMVQFLSILFSFILMVCSILLIMYCNQRYKEMRKWVDENLEPQYRTFRPQSKCCAPHCIYIFTSMLFFIAAIAVVVTSAPSD